MTTNKPDMPNEIWVSDKFQASSVKGRAPFFGTRYIRAAQPTPEQREKYQRALEAWKKYCAEGSVAWIGPEDEETIREILEEKLK